MLTKVRTLYNDRLTIENIGLYLLEYVGKQLAISPVKIYRIADMVKAIQDKIHEGWESEGGVEEVMMLSLNEWLKRYVDESVILTDRQQITSLCHLLKSETPSNLFQAIWPVAPQVYLAARLINYLEQERNERDESRI